MSISDLNNLHFTAAEMTAINNTLAALQVSLAAKCRNLSPGERKTYGSVNEHNKLLIHKARDYRASQPGMSSPDVDWTEFEADYADRNFLETVLAKLTVLAEMAGDTKIQHDYDVYQAALMDYDYTKYKMGTNQPGYDTKHDDMRQFFPSGGGASAQSPENPQT